jgi:hypothetical protein
MIDPRHIAANAALAAGEAAKKRKEPFVVWGKEELDSMPPFPFPELGDYCPKGWKKVEELWCATTRMDDGPALSPEGLKLKIEEYMNKTDGVYGFAVGNVGQFQLYLNVYKQTNKKTKRGGA